MARMPATRRHRSLRAKELSVVARDLDRTWLQGTEPSGDSHFVDELSGLKPQTAAQVAAARIRSAPDDSVSTALSTLGILRGRLTPTRAIPSGVFVGWRSALPIVLIADTLEEPPSASDVWRQVGILLFGHRETAAGHEDAEVFAEEISHLLGT